MMVLPYLLTFCRMAIGMLFAYSSITKVGDLPRFSQAITRLNLLPHSLSKSTAVLLLGYELLIVLLLIAGEPFIGVAFGGAMVLLLLFTIAILLSLAKGLNTSCHCFGKDNKPISHYDVARNLGLLSIATVGLWMSHLSKSMSSLTIIETLLISIVASIFMLIWLNLRDILQLFQIA